MIMMYTGKRNNGESVREKNNAVHDSLIQNSSSFGSSTPSSTVIYYKTHPTSWIVLHTCADSLATRHWNLKKITLVDLIIFIICIFYSMPCQTNPLWVHYDKLYLLISMYIFTFLLFNNE